MQRAEILAKGDIQKVGYRDLVESIARDFNISGMAHNQGPFDVKIVAEGQKDALKELVSALLIRKRPIKVQELEVSCATATGEFPYFKIVRGNWKEELDVGLDFMVELLRIRVELEEQTLAVNKENQSV